MIVFNFYDIQFYYNATYQSMKRLYKAFWYSVYNVLCTIQKFRQLDVDDEQQIQKN